MPTPPASLTPSEELRALGRHRFVSLTTFRKSGAGVPTPVWIAAFGNDLVVTTPAGSGKLKRLRNNPRVLLTPCGRFGAVADDAVPVEATCEILGPDRDHLGQKAVLRRKYGAEYRVVVAMEALHRRLRHNSDGRIILRITAPTVTD